MQARLGPVVMPGLDPGIPSETAPRIIGGPRREPHGHRKAAPPGRSWRRRKRDNSGGMDYLESLPKRLVTVYLPLAAFLFVLLFPFYWMTITAFKSNEELLNYRDFNPLIVSNPTLSNIHRLLF